MPDLERLQSTLDDVANMVEWAVRWLEVLEDEVSFADDSDRPLLEADAKRLRAVADALLPDRVRDPASGRRWYLAPDDAQLRAASIDKALDDADSEVEQVLAHLAERRRAAREREARRKERERERDELLRHQRALVTGYLRDRGPCTIAQIAEGTGLSKTAAKIAADDVARRGRDQRYRLP
ncbi:MAG: hypothetical protein M3N29_01770 [Chloroflexota bacterium]|nr:hypothetical protein [Chloroflexota bacterium]